MGDQSVELDIDGGGPSSSTSSSSSSSCNFFPVVDVFGRTKGVKWVQTASQPKNLAKFWDLAEKISVRLAPPDDAVGTSMENLD